MNIQRVHKIPPGIEDNAVLQQIELDKRNLSASRSFKLTILQLSTGKLFSTNKFQSIFKPSPCFEERVSMKS